MPKKSFAEDRQPVSPHWLALFLSEQTAITAPAHPFRRRPQYFSDFLFSLIHASSALSFFRSVCTEAGMYAIRSRRKVASEKDFLDAVNKVIKSYAKFSSTPRYMTYN